MSGLAPTITSNGGGSSALISISENTAAVTTVAATDPEGDVLAYSISGGADRLKFKIDSKTGALTFIAAPNFEAPADSGVNNVYDVTVRVYDGTTYVTQTLAVTVTDVGSVTVDGTSGNDLIDPTHGIDGLLPDIDNDILNGYGGNDILDGGIGADTMSGGWDDDTYFVDNAGDLVIEIGGEGGGLDTVNSWVSFSLGDYVENLILQGTESINGTGNGLANSIVGTSGNNVLDGGAGADVLEGGAGNDTYKVDSADDTVTEGLNAGTDTVLSSAEVFTLADNVENLTLLDGAVAGSGNGLANVLTGNAGDNTLEGGGGNDTINGGAGADWMLGGVGNDTYTVDDVDDLVTENADEGTDTVLSSLAYTLGLNVENLTLTGTADINATGNGLKNVLKGNSGVNVLRGFAGADTLDGGTGADTMYGGNGADIYYVDNAGDAVIETSDASIDLVNTKISYTLGAYVENGSITNAADGITLTGNALNNTLNGYNGDNVLTGLEGNDILNGKYGADTMIGGVGDDAYYCNQSGDVVVELDGEGTDTVNSDVTFDLGLTLENLNLTGASAVNGTGNGGANIINGNYAANILTALGGDDTIDGKEGADTMIGGAGDDTYYVDNVGDVVTEIAGEGLDTVSSKLSDYTLAANVEKLMLGGGYNINGTGNELSNILIGNKGNNTLSGLNGNDNIKGMAGADKIIAGMGADDLWGGDGNDRFVITNAAESGSNDATNDWIYDFAEGDKLDISLVDANTGVGGDQAFVIDTDGSFSAGEISVVTSGLDVFLSFNIDADAEAEMTVRLKNVVLADITAVDFVL